MSRSTARQNLLRQGRAEAGSDGPVRIRFESPISAEIPRPAAAEPIQQTAEPTQPAAEPVKKRAQAIMQMPDYEPPRREIKIDGPGGMRIYSAIVGREPALDPTAPDILDGTDSGRTWIDHVRDDLGKALHLKNQTPSWRDIAVCLTKAASHKLSVTRRKIVANFQDGPTDRAA